MAQITSGLWAIFSHPKIFDVFQGWIGAGRARDIFVEKFLRMDDTLSVLDIGCGTAELLRHLPEDVFYVGFDLSEKYIEAAKRNFHSRNAKFVTMSIDETSMENSTCFDRVTACGLVHHLDDREVIQLFQLAKKVLKKDGFFVSIDPCFVDEQSVFSRVIVNCDRGKNVRNFERYQELAESVFGNVVIHHRTDLLLIPYDHAILVCS